MGGYSSSAEEMDLRPRFPLVMCKDCKIRKVRHYVSRTPENYMRHFYKCINHGNWKGACDMWKWEDEYEVFLLNNDQDVQQQSLGSSSIGRASEVKGSLKRRKQFMAGGSSEIDRHLLEIIWLLKCVIFGIGMLAFMLFIYLIKQ